MSESEETKPAQEQKFSSVTEGATPSLEMPEAFLEVELTEEPSPETETPKKVEFKKHSPSMPHSAPVEKLVVVNPEKEIAANAPQVGTEVEIDFILDRKRISLTALSTLAEGEVLTLSGDDFRATLFLQEKAIAEAELVMVDQRPSLQITKVFAS
ncbi:MAG: FliM/FliN family flagellar motor C-terminal domain-containing protein [Verrucomicrobiae bacterium]|nr:FliM/FliN family flagellar motor C-terminal domain-containing protein [Verrucomicrobiae bacterium]